MADYNLSLGLESTQLFDELQKIKNAVTELQTLAKQNGAALTQSFTDAANASKEVVSQTVKVTGQLGIEAKAAGEAGNQFKGMLDSISKISGLSTKSFDPSQLLKFNSTLKDTRNQLIDLAAKQTNAFDKAKVAELGFALQGTKDDFKQLQLVIEFIKNNIGDLALSPIDTTNLQQAIDLLQTLFQSTKQIPPIVPPQIPLTGLQALQAELNKTTVDFNALKTAIDTANAELKLLPTGSAEFNTLSAAIESATAKLNAQAQSIDQLKIKLSNLTISVGAETDVQQIAALNQEIDKTKAAIDRLQNAGKEGFDNLGNKIITASDRATTLTTRIRAITNELAGMQKGTPQFNALINEAAQLTDELGDTRQQIQLLASDTSHLDAGIQAVQGLVGVFAAAQGAVALFGDQDEELQKTLLKVNAAMALLQGLQQAGQILDKNSALNVFLLKTFRLQDVAATEAQLAAQEEYNAALIEQAVLTGGLTEEQAALAVADVALAGAETEATVAQEGLNAAMLSNPAGILLIAIGALVGALILFGNTAETEAEKLERFNKSLDDVSTKAATSVAKQRVELDSLLTVAGDVTKSETEREAAITSINNKMPDYIDKLTLENIATADGSEIIKEYIENLSKKALAQAFASKLEELYVKQIEAENSALEDNVNWFQALFTSIKNGGSITQSSIDLANKARIERQKNVDSIKGEISVLEKSFRDALKTGEALLDTDDSIKSNFQDRLKSATAYAQARVDIAQKGTKEELDAQLALIDSERIQALAAENLTQGERFKIFVEAEKKKEDVRRAFRISELNNEISNQQAIANAAIEGSREEFDAKNKLLDLQAQIEIKNAQDNADKINQINTKLFKDKAELQKQFDSSIVTAGLDAEISRINEELAFVQKGSEDELDLRKFLVDQEAALQANAARNSIKDEQALQTRLAEIIGKANADKLALDRAFWQDRIDTALQFQKSLLAIQNAQQQNIIDDPFSTDRERRDARKQILQNELQDLFNQRAAITQAFLQGLIPDRQKYETEINNIIAEETKKRKELEEAAQPEPFDLTKFLGGLVGLTEEQTNQILGSFGSLFDSINSLAEANAQKQIDAIDEIIDKLDEQIDAQQDAVDKQKELSDDGLANDLRNQQKVLDDLKAKKAEEIAQREDAAKKLQEIQKRTQIVQAASVLASNIETSSQMILSAAHLFGSFSKIPLGIGIPIAIAVIGGMLAAFLSIKAAFTKAATEGFPKLRHGGTIDSEGEVLKGPSHEERGLGLYNEKTGHKIAEFEGKEYLSVFNKESTQKHHELIREFTTAINKDMLPVTNFEAIHTILHDGRMPMQHIEKVVIMQKEVEHIKLQKENDNKKELIELREEVTKFRKEFGSQYRGKVIRIDMGDYWLEKENGRTRKIYKR